MCFVLLIGTSFHNKSESGDDMNDGFPGAGPAGCASAPCSTAQHYRLHAECSAPWTETTDRITVWSS